MLAGGYRLREPALVEAPRVVLASCGAVLPEALHAAEALESEGIAATVLDVVSPDRLYRGGATSCGPRAATCVGPTSAPPTSRR